MTFIVSTDCCAPGKLFFECEHTLSDIVKSGEQTHTGKHGCILLNLLTGAG